MILNFHLCFGILPLPQSKQGTCGASLFLYIYVIPSLNLYSSILQKEGYKVSTRDFIRIGIPFTLIAALSGAIVIWLIWA